MNKNFVNNVLLQFTSLLYQVPQTDTCALVVLLLSVNYIDQSSAVLDLVSLFVLEGIVTRKVNYVELNVFIVVHRLILHLNCWQ